MGCFCCLRLQRTSCRPDHIYTVRSTLCGVRIGDGVKHAVFHRLVLCILGDSYASTARYQDHLTHDCVPRFYHFI
jgi:hypothetical protein